MGPRNLSAEARISHGAGSALRALSERIALLLTVDRVALINDTTFVCLQ